MNRILNPPSNGHAGMAKPPAVHHRFTPAEKAVLQTLTEEPQTAEEIHRRSGYGLKTVRSALTDLTRIDPPVIRKTADGYLLPTFSPCPAGQTRDGTPSLGPEFFEDLRAIRKLLRRVCKLLRRNASPAIVQVPAGAVQSPCVACPSAVGGNPNPPPDRANGRRHYAPREIAILEVLTEEPQKTEVIARKAGYTPKTTGSTLTELARIEPPVVRKTPDGWRTP
jgi:hypothetical protein